MAMSRCLSQGMTEGSSPADPPPSARPRSHGPIALRRAHTRVLTQIASPADSFSPAFLSHASMSSIEDVVHDSRYGTPSSPVEPLRATRSKSPFFKYPL